MTPGQIIEIVQRLEALDERLERIERSRAVDREIAKRVAKQTDENLRKWARRASIAAVVGPFLTILGAGAALALHAT